MSETEIITQDKTSPKYHSDKLRQYQGMVLPIRLPIFHKRELVIISLNPNKKNSEHQATIPF